MSPILELFWSVLMLCSVAVSCGCGAQLRFSVLNADPELFYPPLTMMWLNNSCLLVCFPLFVLYERSSTHKSVGDIFESAAQIFAPNGFKLSHFLGRELSFLLLFTLNNYAFSLALGKISTSAALAIHSLEVSIVYVLGRLVLRERFSPIKTAAVVLAIGGVMLIALDNEFSASPIGVCLVILGSLSSALYKICFKRMSGKDTPLCQTALFLSGMGLANLVANCVPAAILLHFGVERIDWTAVPWASLAGFVGLTLIYNVATMFGLALLNPLAIAIGVRCGIPISIGIDVFLRERSLTLPFTVGALCLLLSVFLATFHQHLGGLLCGKRERSEQSEGKTEAEQPLKEVKE